MCEGTYVYKYINNWYHFTPAITQMHSSPFDMNVLCVLFSIKAIGSHKIGMLYVSVVQLRYSIDPFRNVYDSEQWISIAF